MRKRGFLCAQGNVSYASALGGVKTNRVAALGDRQPGSATPALSSSWKRPEGEMPTIRRRPHTCKRGGETSARIS